MTTSPADPAALARLLQLASPTLPVGGFSYSQGLEAAIELGWVRDAEGVAHWLHSLLDGPVGWAEAEYVARLLRAWQAGPDAPALLRLDRLYQASREGRELLAESRQMAWSLLSLIDALPPHRVGPGLAALLPTLGVIRQGREPGYPVVWTCLAAGMALDPADALCAWLWSWLENQVMAALKTVPLGQNAGQTLLFELGAALAPVVARALARAAEGDAARDPAQQQDDAGPGNFAPGFALACARHETQYSRLFRS